MGMKTIRNMVDYIANIVFANNYNFGDIIRKYVTEIFGEEAATIICNLSYSSNQLPRFVRLIIEELHLLGDLDPVSNAKDRPKSKKIIMNFIESEDGEEIIAKLFVGYYLDEIDDIVEYIQAIVS